MRASRQTRNRDETKYDISIAYSIALALFFSPFPSDRRSFFLAKEKQADSRSTFRCYVLRSEKLAAAQ